MLHRLCSCLLLMPSLLLFHPPCGASHPSRIPQHGRGSDVRKALAEQLRV